MKPILLKIIALLAIVWPCWLRLCAAGWAHACAGRPGIAGESWAGKCGQPWSGKCRLGQDGKPAPAVEVRLLNDLPHTYAESE